MAPFGLVAAAPSTADSAISSDSALWDLLPCAAYVCDVRAVVVRYNRKAAELWGCEPQIGEPEEGRSGAYQLRSSHGEPLTRENTPAARAVRDDRSYHGVEIVIEQPSGRSVVAELNIDPLRDDYGAIIGAICCLQDVTQRRQAERRLQGREQHLHAIIETTPEVHHDRRAGGRSLEYQPRGPRDD